MGKNVAIAAALASTSILVAVGELSGGTKDEKGKVLTSLTVEDGEEVTAEKLAALGLDDKAVADLVTRGKLARLDVRQAESGDAAELAAAIERATEAEAKVAQLEKDLEIATKPKTVAELEALLAAAKKPAQA